MTRSRVLVRSDNVGHLNATGVEAMRAYGVTTVLDLRSRGETISKPSPFAGGSGATYVNRELIDDANMTRIGDPQSMFERYLFIVDNRRQAFAAIFGAIAEAEGCVLFHCFAGKDRTGLVAAMLLSLAGVEAKHIGSDYSETDVQLAQQYEVWIGEASPEDQAATREELRCPPERILGVLDHIERGWGGVAGYLEAAGLALQAIDRLSSRLSTSGEQALDR